MHHSQAVMLLLLLQAATDGGAMSFYPDVYDSGKLLTLTDVTMVNNSAENFGGGLAIGSQALVMENVTFDGNMVRISCVKI
jgi:hypothetical protein